MKKVICIKLIVMLAFILAPSVMAQDFKAIKLIWSDYAPPMAGGNVFLKKEWAPRINEQIAKMGYKLDITYYHSSSLYKMRDQVQALEDGLIDFTTFVPSYEVARAPLHEVLSMPLMGWDCYGGSRMWFELQETIPEFGAEFSKYKEIFHLMSMPGILNANRELRVPGDFKGVKMQASGQNGDMFRSIGAVPMTIPPSDWYTSLERGLIESITLGIYGVTMFKLQEVVKVHIYPYNDSFGFPALSFIMNRKKYESLPSGVRKAIDDNVMWASRRMNEISDGNIPKSEEICRELDHTFIELTPEEMNLWYAAVKPIQLKWIQEMDAKGLPGRKVFEEAKRLAKGYEEESFGIRR